MQEEMSNFEAHSEGEATMRRAISEVESVPPPYTIALGSYQNYLPVKRTPTHQQLRLLVTFGTLDCHGPKCRQGR